ncbi:MAG: 50S ribosomal protein L13 [Dehalococcoidia bacterium]|jgi:large subunit ribosomal protein L13|nr:50S ribosomal protein L13 [Dehalococcoidia bacterium]MEC7920078.1 50S ribosomal protein L13 [Chloroflexota bacterium]MEC9099205.1 50S ribosomal protein L13 [Chloroflexota bacterium]MQF84000.1 50S ribosomal protein L13 [SAR202 cluster bacterium]GIS30687.1 MAG: 50S ribosomal protein L13 [Dehalococcoidia bacterium]|tara:strand:- start:919 stop:1374 length:456 start_codon:yes stop_codon:yes gene_type:complete
MINKLKHYSIKEKKDSGNWILIDAEGQTLGRMASNIAMILMGKNKPSYISNDITGDFVVLINASKVKVTGKKYFDKEYITHTTRPGSTKIRKFSNLIDTNPEYIVNKAVKGMLPKNKLSAKMLKRLKIYPGSEHPHQAQIDSNSKEVKSDN